MLEYQEIIEQKYGAPTANAFIALLNELPNVLLITTYYHWNLMTTDPDDDKYCDCAIAGQADSIITEDRHFAIINSVPFPSLRIISIDAFSALV